MPRYDTASGSGAPGFLEARNRWQKARAAGMHPDYWYPVEWSRRLQRGKAMGTRFWGRPIAIFRDEDGQVHALEDRCAHRQVRLSLGQVDGCKLRCMHHGWSYSGDGRLAEIPHDLFGKPFPQIQLTSFPVQERYGLIWIFPGNPEMAAKRPLKDIPELEGGDRWASVPVDFTWRAHHSMVIDDVSDLAHAYLPRSSRPFAAAKLARLESVEDRVCASYETQLGPGLIKGLFAPRNRPSTGRMELCYEYPFRWSNTDDKIKHHCFVLPLDERHTRSFFIFYFRFRMLRAPILPSAISTRVMDLIAPLAERVLVRPLLREDGDAVIAEQEGYDMFHESPIAELNPAVAQFQQLTIRKWEEYLASARSVRGAGAESSPERRSERAVHSPQLRVQP
jgi:nitrite reductase/ring-hydroxylating ferredoxin subunit